MTYEDLRPNRVRPVQVSSGGHWWNGELEAYRREKDGTWRGWVRWAEGVGATRIAWLGEDRIRSGSG